MRRFMVAVATVGMACGATMLSARAQDGGDESVREKVERGVGQISEQLRKGWAEVRAAVDKLGVEGRVYGRLHWDKELTEAVLDIRVLDDHGVVLRGSVPNQSAKRKAVRLTQDTVGVKRVVDELAVLEK